ncbi:MarR family winged helix-turn-helix transcriptional regulator [Glutamicibacter arilaitensis]|uniref:MarR family winged helix-turn-helix transcriptional regulator n=1 Tax=Glutamicibacter arilaitensis TaxID=256701 RepID=UPI00384B8573
MPTQESGPDLVDLFNRSSRLLRGKWRQTLTPYDITPHQVRTLMLLGREETEGMRNSQLAERLHIAPRSTTEVIDQLVAKELAKRTPDPADRRASLITLTVPGKALLKILLEERKHSHEEFFATLGDDDRNELTRILGLLVADAPARPRC